jgi:hypothetical protein
VIEKWRKLSGIGIEGGAMQSFFRTRDGHLRGLRVGACFYVFNTLLSVISDGWRSGLWLPWILMAVGFFAISQVVEGPRVEGSKWHSPTYLVGVAATFLGVSFLVYRVIERSAH